MLIEIRLLGRFSARRGEEEIPPGAFRQRLTRSLVQVLLTRRGSYVSRDALTQALWPKRLPADPAANLRVLVNLARRALGDPTLLLTGAGGYSFAGGAACVVDAEVFCAKVEAGQAELSAARPSAALAHLHAALDLWAGEPLAEHAHEGWAAPSSSRPGSGARRLAPFEQLAFVGRETELQAVHSALSRPAPGTVVVSGVAGVGKSRLLAEVAAHSSVPVIAARAFSPEKDDAWALARSLLREALALDCEAPRALPDRPAQALAELVPELEDLRPSAAVALDPESRRALTLEGSALLLWALGARGALVVVDDLQWADASSLDLLGLVIARSGVRVLLAYRPEEVGESAPVAAFLAGLPTLGREVLAVGLEPLSSEAIGQLVADS